MLFISQDNSLQAVWSCSPGERRLIRFVLVIRGQMNETECDPSIHVIVFAVWIFLLIGSQSLILEEEWTVVRKMLSLNGEISSSVSFKCLQNLGRLLSYDYELGNCSKEQTSIQLHMFYILIRLILLLSLVSSV